MSYQQQPLPSDITAQLSSLAESFDVLLWGIELVEERGTTVLRIYLDKAEGEVSLDDCARVSRQVSAILDVEDPIKQEYNLEVSSTGMERPFFSLEQIRPFVGQKISVYLKDYLDNRRKFKGQINQVSDDSLQLAVDNDTVDLPSDLIKKAHLLYQPH